MYDCVPDLQMDDDYSIRTSSALTRQKAEDNIMELLWQDGHVVMQSQSQTHRAPMRAPSSKTPVQPPPLTSPPPQQTLPPLVNTHLYMAEDEMATWLHYPLEDLYTELLYTSTPAPSPPPPTQSSTIARAADIRFPPPPPPPRSQPPQLTRNFPHFSSIRGRTSESPGVGPSSLTVVDSNDTPVTGGIAAVGGTSGTSTVATNVGDASAAVSQASPSGPAGGDVLGTGGGSGDMTVTSSLSASGSAGSGATAATTAVEGREAVRTQPVEDRKRKGRETDEPTASLTATECHNEDAEQEHDEKKHSRGSTSTKRSRAAEVHNLSERRRRDRINEKMKALQELIPRCNKSDKASMLDEAIEYLKSLQMQVQMMSMGCGMVPMMYPGMQQPYMPPMGMGMGMGTGMPMGMDMGMTRPVLPLPPAIPGSPLPTPPTAAAQQLAPRFAVPAYSMPAVPAPDLSGLQGTNQSDSARRSFHIQSSGLPQLPNLGASYQHYLALQQMQMQLQMQMQMQMQVAQKQSHSQPSLSKPSTSRSEDVDDNKRS